MSADAPCPLRTVLFRFALAAMLVLAGTVVVVWSGRYAVAAARPHAQPVSSLLETTVCRSASNRWRNRELAWMIRHGIRMSTMPAWGGRLPAAGIWAVVGGPSGIDPPLAGMARRGAIAVLGVSLADAQAMAVYQGGLH